MSVRTRWCLLLTGALILGLSTAGAAPSPKSPRPTGLSAADVRLTADVEGGRAGFDVASVGDLDGDGFGDLVIGAYGDPATAGPFTGAVYVVYGPVVGDIDLAHSAAKIVGADEGDFVGEDQGGAGDVDGDGYADLLVGAPGSIPGFQPGPPKPGAAYLFYGSPNRLRGTISLAEADAAFVGSAPVDFAGFGLPPQGAGDLDGDGYDDVAVGSAAWGAETGKVYVIYGRPERFASTVALDDADLHLIGAPGDFAGGWAVAGAGDIDGDGTDELLIGAAGDLSSQLVPGRAYVVKGGARRSGSMLLADADVILEGEFPGDRAGRAVAAAGDVDGDGFGDLLIGASQRAITDTGRPGAAYVVYGGPHLEGTVPLADAGMTLVGDGANDQAGRSVAADDVNRDGFSDVVVGAPLHDGPAGADSGAAYVVFGGPRPDQPIQLRHADLILFGEAADDRAGSGVAAGRLGRTASADLLVGAELSDAGATDAGRAYVVYGSAAWKRPVPARAHERTVLRGRPDCHMVAAVPTQVSPRSAHRLPSPC